MYQDPNGAWFRRSRIGLGDEWEGKKETENGRDEKLHKPERVADSVVPVNPILPSLVDKRSYSVPALAGRTDRSTRRWKQIQRAIGRGSVPKKHQPYNQFQTS